MSAKSKVMSKTQIIGKLAEQVNLPKKAVAQVLNDLAALAVKETKGGGVFVIPGVGRTVKVARKARMGRNPATGESIKIPAKTVVKMRLAKAFKDAVVPPKKK